MIRFLTLLISTLSFLLGVSTGSYAQMSCAKVLQIKPINEKTLHNLLVSTRNTYVKEPTQSNLEKHMNITSNYLNYHDVEHSLHRNVIYITNANTPYSLNSFASKANRSIGAETSYDPKALRESSALGLLRLSLSDDGLVSPKLLLLSFEAILKLQAGGVEAHEMAHGLDMLFGANKKGLDQGSIFTAWLIHQNNSYSLSEVRSYFATFSLLISSFRKNEIDQNQLQRAFRADVKSLAPHVKSNQKAINSALLNPVSPDGLMKLTDTYYGNLDASLAVLLSPRGDGTNIVTVKIETDYGYLSVILTDPFFFYPELEDLTSQKNSAQLEMIFSKLDAQLNKTKNLLAQTKALLESHPKHKAFDEKSATDFIRTYRSIIMPHLRARFDVIP